MRDAGTVVVDRVRGLWRQFLVYDVDSDPLTARIGLEQAREAGRGAMRTFFPTVGLVLVLALFYRNEVNSLLLPLCAAYEICVVIAAQFLMPFTRFSRVEYKSVSSRFRAVMFYTAMSASGWGCLFISASLGASPAEQASFLYVHVGIICLGGLTYAMISRASLLYLAILTLFCMLHISVLTYAISGLLYGAVIVMSVMLGHAFLQMSQQFVGRMRAEYERLEAERRAAEAERHEIERVSQAEIAARVQQEKERERALDERQATMLALANRYEQSVAALARQLDDAVNALASATEDMSRFNTRAHDKAQRVLDLAISSTHAIQSVAESTDALKQYAAKITAEAQEQVAIGAAASHAGDTGLRSLAALAEEANSIDDVVRLIQNMASQTGLLSLNATIEAARAGEAGRGFAIVANEVKQLAAQTQGAVARIGEIIEGTRGKMLQADGAMRSVAKTIGAVSRSAGAIAESVAEQRQATWEISEAAAHTAHASTDVKATAEEVAREAQQADALAEEMRGIVASMRAKSESLRVTSNDFLATLREDRAA